MKRRLGCSLVWCLVALAAARSAAAAATLSVTPSAVGSTYSGTITLQVGGLADGEAVQIRKYMDLDANGIVDGSDMLVQSFRLIDGVAATIGGVTNINVPGDYTPTNGTIVAPLDFQLGGVGQGMVGQYAYILSSPGGQFAPVTNLFSVTNSAFAQSFTGVVVCSGTNVPYASVMLFTPPSDDGGMVFVVGTVANSSGGYTIPAPTGTYLLLVSRDGYIADFSAAPVLALGSGATVTANLNLVAADRTISGRVIDSVNTNRGLAGFLVVCESSSGLAIGFTDTNGNFTVPVIAGQWRLGSDDRQVTFYGYLRSRNEGYTVDATAGNVSGVSVALTRCTALIYGRIKDDQNRPLAGVGLYGNQNNGTGPYEGSATTDSNGNYALGIVAGTWQASVSEDDPAYRNYVFSRMDNTTVSNGQAVLHNFVGILATNHITGFVRDGDGHPVADVFINASAIINNTTFNVGVNTGTNGAYSIHVANGSWSLSLDCGYLSSLGLTCPGNRTVTILNADAVVNFDLANLQITTSSLPDGTMGVFYSQSLTASGGQTPYTWSLGPGFWEMPFGLTLSPDGLISGTPNGYGWTFFGVRVSDNQGAIADQLLTLNILPAPLQITTTSLPVGTNGQFYYQQIIATGGQPPHNWYLPNGSGSLPSGLDLTPGGVLAGTPTTQGQFNFPVSVYVNSPYDVATQWLSLTIAAAPLQVTTTSPLPDATRDSFYITTLAANGGQPPYRWSLAPGSPELPIGLALSTNGVLSGAPRVSGGFWFIARVTDSALATRDWMLGLTINDVPPLGLTLTAPRQPAAGQFQFTFNTAPGTNYTIQYSSNLTTWNPILTFGGSGLPMTFTDQNANGSPRFYRVKIGP